MSFPRTYIHTVLVALDSFLSALLFNRADCTISALCRVVQLADAQAPGWQWKVDRVLKLWPWQAWVLRVIGRGLNLTFAGHCEAARLSDLLRAGSTLKLLDDETTADTAGK